ncbi:MAG: SIMPL domain-containing protein [Hyphomicrobiaceae bacterium]
MTRTTPAVVAAFIAALTWIGATVPASAQEKRTERTVTVGASGMVSVEPDIAHISTGLLSEADTAREALQRNSAAMKKIVDGLKGAGIDPKDVQTSRFSIDPRYDQPKDGRTARITGYRVVNQVRITARDISKLGELLDLVVTLGANQAGGISFDVSNAETLKDEARRQAIANALRRAKLFAEAAGATVGDVLTIAEDASMSSPPIYSGRAMAAESVPIERGSQSLEVRVQVTWTLR